MSEPAPRRELEIRSDRPFDRVVVDGVEHRVDPPTRRARVPVAASARRLTVITQAGGERSAKLGPEQRSVVVRFGVGSVRRSVGTDPLGTYNPYADGD
jgi:hypothetical protein